mgnify:FL=1
MKYKLAMEDGDEEIARLCSEYNKFLSYCNAVDFVDILQRVKTCFIVDTDAKNNFQTLQQLVVVGKPNTQLEVGAINLRNLGLKPQLDKYLVQNDEDDDNNNNNNYYLTLIS